MNWRVFIFLAFTFSAYLNAQDALPYEPCPSDEYYMYFYEPCNATFSPDSNNTPSADSSYGTTTNYSTPSNVQYGWSTAKPESRIYQSHGWPSSSERQASVASICQSWNVQEFAHEIQCSINHCMTSGYSRQQAEACILEQHVLYSFSNFITNIKQFDGYRSYIRELHQRLLNNQGKFYRLRKALWCVNRRYIQLLEITEQLYNEIVQQEKLEGTRYKTAQSNNHTIQQLNKPSLSEQQTRIYSKHETVQKTFDEQRDALAHEFDQWHVFQEIYQEEQFGDTTRIERRIQTLQVINNGHVVYTEQTYTLSSAAKTLLRNNGSDCAHYTTHYGNQLQQVIHQECIEGIEHLATMHTSNMMHPYRQGIAQCFDAAREYNQEGLTHKASAVADLCWMILDCGVAIAEGAVAGVIEAVKDMAEHPVQTAICAVAGEYVLAYQLGKILYNVADIGITALSDPDQAWQKWDACITPVTQLIEALENKQLTLRDALKGATQFAVQWKTQDKLLKSLGTICATAKTKAIEFAKNNPLTTPQEYMAIPEGILLKSMHNTPPSGSSLKYERSSKFFVANHEEITALTEQA